MENDVVPQYIWGSDILDTDNTVRWRGVGVYVGTV